MSWSKLGNVFNPKVTKKDWYKDTFLTPTPFLKDKSTIRVYGGLRDAEGASRIGYVDIDANDPTKVLKVSDKPVLDLGNDGMFDDNGVILGDVVRASDGSIRMYYVGFQLPAKAKFLAFTGVAISHDGGDTFKRHQEKPILDRAPNGHFFNAIHTALYENGKWKFWCGAGSKWQKLGDNIYPSYSTWYAESENGLDAIEVIAECLVPEGREYRIGRPRVIKLNGQYHMFFTSDTLDKEYRGGVAISEDGIKWRRTKINYPVTVGNGWESEMACYFAPFVVDNNLYACYNGNGMGRTGFGLVKYNGELINYGNEATNT